MPILRLDKYLADCGIATRKELRQIIKDGRVSVNGAAQVSPQCKLDPEIDTVSLDGSAIRYEKFRYFMLNKPSGVLSATEDGKQNTVLDLLTPEHKRLGLFPVGRLDKDTTGLLLLTNDGEFAHKVISPKSNVKKRYRAETEGKCTEGDVEAFKNGIVLKDGLHCLPAELEIAEDCCYVTVFEGKYHQVKRMLASVGKPVTALHRVSIGRLTLDESLGAGEYRELDRDELCSVFN